ncbi:uncharacterized protein EAF01_011255 [Botrytis porri]|uniref:RING-type domain-containing protein n=1 Tax=Botrytis porri TaxID=87229 RepID=A0A4Z1KZ80_9HELO|nr:uncharacterized protein EAF01_011255 [Botrytis porri]KAF7886577.1 hypothetical protein EAF01_011255 [Botrytis porri]TGO89760.1 hypothetical protein BPOR_0095g00210 [Botrytis porri]
MTKFSNFFRDVGGSITGAFYHKGAKHSGKTSQIPRPDTPPNYEDLFGQPTQLPEGLDEAAEHEAFLMRMARDPSILEHSSESEEDFPQDTLLDRMAHNPSTRERRVRPNNITSHIPIVSRLFSMSPQVTIPVSRVEVEPRQTTPSPFDHSDNLVIPERPKIDHSDNLVVPEPEVDPAEPFLHLVEEAIAASSPQAREVTPEQEAIRQDDTIAANSGHQSRGHTHRSSQGRCMSSHDTEDAQLPPRVVSSPEPRASVSRIPIAARSSSLQDRSTVSAQPSSRPESSDPRRARGQSAGRGHGEPSQGQPRAVSAPQPGAQSSSPVAVRQNSTQPRGVHNHRDIIQRHARVSAHHTSLVGSTDNTAQQLPMLRQRPYPVVAQDESDELTGEPNPVEIQDFLARDRSASQTSHSNSQRALSSGDLTALRSQHASHRDTASGTQVAHQRSARSNDVARRTEAGNSRSNRRQDAHDQVAERSSNNHHLENSDLNGSNARSGNEAASSDSSGSSIVGMDAHTRETTPKISRPSSSETTRPTPEQCDPVHPGITSPLLIAELHHGRANGASRPPVIGPYLAERLDAARAARGLPRSPRMWDIPTPNDEINNPVHPADFRGSGYQPTNRDPVSNSERPPTRSNSAVHGGHRQRRAGHQGTIDSMHSRELALDRELQEIREQERQRAIREVEERRRENRERRNRERERRAREKRDREQKERDDLKKKRSDAVDGILQPIHIDRCFCLEKFGDGGSPHERVKLAHCTHIFGRSCIKEWLMMSDTCPQCVAAHSTLSDLSRQAQELILRHEEW